MAKVLFVQPFTVSEKTAAQCEGRVVVLDVAFNGGSPQGKGTPEEQFAATTVAFINALGDRLVGWVDHHPHKAWPSFSGDTRFHLYTREVAPACPPVITADLVAEIGEVDTIVAHGDFDGVMSAAKFVWGGWLPYDQIDTDSVAADTRVGELSAYGRLLEEAMKADLRDDNVRLAVFNTVAYSDDQAYEQVKVAQRKYASIQAATTALSEKFFVNGKVAYVDAAEADGFDLTALLLAGQKKAAVAVVRNTQQGKPQITVAAPKGWDFVTMFGLAGGMPNRVNVPDQEINSVIEKINA